MDKLGIERRLLTAGTNKALGDPFSPLSETHRAHLQATLEGLGARRLFDSREMPGRIVDVLAVRSESGATHAGALRALVSAHFGALAVYRANPQAMAAELAPWLKLPVEQVPSAFRGLHLPSPAESLQLLAPGGYVAAGLPGLVALMREQGLLSGPVDTSTLLDTRWLASTP